MPAAAPLTGDTTCDVCIVGGGIAGLLIAERLSREGVRVAMVERGEFAAGETARTTAHFASALDDRLYQIERLHGRDGARLAAESHQAAINYVEALVNDLGTPCGWQRLDGYLVMNEHHMREREELFAREIEACRHADLRVEWVGALPAPWPGELGPALRFPHQAQAHPLMLLRGVMQQLLDRHVQLFAHSHVVGIEGGANARVETSSGARISCDHVVVATNTPVNTRVAMHTKQAGYQTYVIAFRIPRGALPPMLLWDGLWESDVSYRYVRVAEAETLGISDDLLIVGGEDHKTGQGPNGEKPFECIADWTRTHFPMVQGIERHWSGEVMEPVDALAYIGRNPTGHENVYIVTGDSGNGMTHGAIAAMLVPDLILGRDNEWATLYDPARKPGLHALTDYAHENANTLAQYFDWFRSGDVESEAEIAPGEGAIIRKGFKHLAVYKDEAGHCTHLNATCPHLAGIVHWNGEERTWDCPCHASRFDRYGKVIHGPANSDLSSAEDESTAAAARADALHSRSGF